METNVTPNPAGAGIMDCSGQVPPPTLSPFTAAIDEEQDRLRHLDRLASLGALTGSIAHEIKNALVGVKTFVDLLAHEHKDSELAPLASAEISRIETLISQVLQCAAKPKNCAHPVPVNAVLQHTIDLLQPALREKGIQLHTAFAAADDAVQGMPDQLKQAFLNVLMNAIEASAAGGTIRLHTRSREKHLSVVIQDFGAGIRPEHLRRLFEPFFTTKHDGTGLGLSITQRIIQEHGGAINVASMPNEGTTFTVRLPRLR